jgi:ABC-type Zn uptake system ZnuABC Zn-binding protein ZnuA
MMHPPPMMFPKGSGTMQRLAIIFVLLGLCCDRSEPPAAPAAPADRLLVVTSVYPLASIARRVGGDRVEVAWWIESGQRLSDYQPGPEQIEQLRRAAAILTNGSAEGPHTEQFSGSFGDQRVIRLDRFAETEQRESQLWLDTTIVAKAARALADRLAALDHANAAEYQQRAAACVQELNDLSAYGDAQLGLVRGRVAASIGKDYSALSRQMRFILSPMGDSLLNLDPARLDRLPAELKQRQASIILLEADAPQAALAQFQSRVPFPTALIDSLGSSAPRGHDSYDKIMRYNYEQLAAAARQAQ